MERKILWPFVKKYLWKHIWDMRQPVPAPSSEFRELPLSQKFHQCGRWHSCLFSNQQHRNTEKHQDKCHKIHCESFILVFCLFPIQCKGRKAFTAKFYEMAILPTLSSRAVLILCLYHKASEKRIWKSGQSLLFIWDLFLLLSGRWILHENHG